MGGAGFSLGRVELLMGFRARVLPAGESSKKKKKKLPVTPVSFVFA